MMANQIDDKPSLPSHLVRCEYLECSGTQYIDLGYPLGYENKVVVEVEPVKTATWLYVFGSTPIKGKRFDLSINTSKYFDGADATFNTPQDYKYSIVFNKEGIVSDGTLYGWKTTPNNFDTEDNVFLFATRKTSGDATYFYRGKIYSCQIYENDVLIHDYIPAFDLNITRAGMYDLVTGAFMINNGTGEFAFELPNIPDTQKPYLCFESVEDDFQAKYSINPCEYSIDDRKTWNELPADTLTPPINAGKKIYFRGRGAKSASIPYSRGTFSTTKLFNISGNMLSMIHGSDFLTEKNDQYSYSWMFKNNKNIVSISENLLNVPVSFRDFYGIFENSSIRNVDIHRFNNGVYYYAFKNSTLEKVNITSSSSLPTQCFTESFSGTQIQELDIPCKSIQYAGLLTAATSCKYLTKVIIRATSITYNESNTNYFNYFKSSFQNCSALNSVIFLVANIPLSKRISDNWLTGVAEEGTIILNKNITWNPEDYRNGNIDNVEGSVTLGETITWGIPANWEVKYCDPDNIDDVRDYREIDQPW